MSGGGNELPSSPTLPTHPVRSQIFEDGGERERERGGMRWKREKQVYISMVVAQKKCEKEVVILAQCVRVFPSFCFGKIAIPRTVEVISCQLKIPIFFCLTSCNVFHALN